MQHELRKILIMFFGMYVTITSNITGSEEPTGAKSTITDKVETSVAENPRVLNCKLHFEKSLLINRYRAWQQFAFSYHKLYDHNFRLEPISSEISSGNIGTNLLRIAALAKKRVVVASDKCKNEDFLDAIGILKTPEGNPLQICVVTGDQDSDTVALFKKPKYSGFSYFPVSGNPDGSGKMHNKFMVIDDTTVITGSPNCTFAAYNNNIESFVSITHHFVAKLYLRYYQYLVSGKNKYDCTQPEYRSVKRMIDVFNSSENRVKVCLAPISGIPAFVTRALNPSQSIKISMFLISRAVPENNDIVSHILQAIDVNSTVLIKVDAGQYEIQKWMQLALAPIIAKGHKVSTVLKDRVGKSKINPLLHDKLILIEKHDGQKIVIIGSAGFSTNVQDNLNLENMVMLYDGLSYTFFLNHFDSINSSRTGMTITDK